MIKESKAYKYAIWCINNEDNKVGRYVKKQAKHWIDIVDGLDDEAYIDESDFDLICTILELMVHPDTRLSMYDSLEDYQWFFIIEPNPQNLQALVPSGVASISSTVSSEVNVTSSTIPIVNPFLGSSLERLA